MTLRKDKISILHLKRISIWYKFSICFKDGGVNTLFFYASLKSQPTNKFDITKIEI